MASRQASQSSSRQRILDRNEPIAPRPAGDLARHRRTVEAALLAREPVELAVEQLRGGHIERQRRVDPRALDAAGGDLEGLLV